MRKIKLFFKLTIVFVVASFFAPTVFAQNIVDVNFESDPLFENLNILPGYQTNRWVKVKNVSDEEQSIAVYADYFSDPDNLASQMDITISSGIDSYYNAKLADFFGEREIYLSDISSGIEKQYDFEIIFQPESGNDYQGKSLDFDIKIGARSKESVGSESSSGGSYFYSDLVIFNETIIARYTSATINWQTNKLATSRVIYDTVSHSDLSGKESPNYGYTFSTIEDSNKINPHSVFIDGLEPDTVYYFRPVSKASPEKYGRELSFKTSQNEDDIIVLGLEGSPELIIDKKCAAEMSNPGEKVSYVIRLENIGDITAFDVSLRDYLPDGFKFAEDSSSEKLWNIGDLSPGEFNELEYSVLVGESVKDGKYNNRAEAEAFNFEKVSAEAELEIKSILVLGAELAVTGFDIRELFILLSLILLLSFISFYINKKYKQKK